ncbi:MAG: HlyD family efflux transporter periplasmic adaptor subunit, partial [Myxococcota bacterium]
MDRKIERRIPRWIPMAGTIAGAVLVLGLAIYAIMSRAEGKIQRLDGVRLTVSQVVNDRFEDFIPVRARVEPAKTIYLDAIEGGRVENIFVEDGAMVTRGQPLVELSNTSLQLEFLAREAEVTEQLNAIRTQELQLERNRLEHKRNLVEINYNIVRLQRLVERTEKVSKDGYVSESELETLKDELLYWRNRKDVTEESQKSDERLQRAQMKQLRSAGVRLQKNLDVAQRTLDSLLVRAPADGKVTALNAEVGQSLEPGERLGQLDDPEEFKLSAMIDEFYVSRVDIGQSAEIAQKSGSAVVATVKKIYPQIRDGQFEVDLAFDDAELPGIRRGQTIQAKLALGDPTTTLILPNGSFYTDTGGNWVFVVSEDGQSA